MRVVKVYFTATQIEADEVVFVTDDHYNADYAAYPVQAIDADVRVYRTDNRYVADSVVVLAGDSMNPYIEYRGGHDYVGNMPVTADTDMDGASPDYEGVAASGGDVSPLGCAWGILSSVLLLVVIGVIVPPLGAIAGSILIGSVELLWHSCAIPLVLVVAGVILYVGVRRAWSPLQIAATAAIVAVVCIAIWFGLQAWKSSILGERRSAPAAPVLSPESLQPEGGALPPGHPTISP